MKKKFYYGIAFVLSLGILSSCSKDENEDNAKLELLEKLNTNFKTNDEANKLELTYSEAPMPGKNATFTSADGKTATIELAGNTISDFSAIIGSDIVMPGVIPGETSTKLNVELVENGDTGFTFEGTDEANGRILNYKGEIAEGKLKLDLKAELAKNELTGNTWSLVPFDDSKIKGALNLTWDTEKKFELFDGFPPLMPSFFLELMVNNLSLIDTGDGNKISVSKAMNSLLQSLTFLPDGNVVAKYSDAKNLASPVWQDSPLNLIHYTAKEGKLYAYLNVDAIMVLANSGNSKSASAILPGLMKIVLPRLPKIIPMLSNGIPLGYRIEDPATETPKAGEETTPVKKFSVFIDNELGMILNEIIVEIFKDEELVAAIKEMMKNDPNFGSMAPMADIIFNQGAEVFGSTTKIELGLDFNEPTEEGATE